MIVTALVATTMTIAPSPAAAAPTIVFDGKVSDTTPSPGLPFTYTFRFRCASTFEDCTGATVTGTVPGGPTVASFTQAGGNVQSVSVAGSTYTWTLKSPLTAGSTGLLNVTLKYPACTSPASDPGPAAATGSYTSTNGGSGSGNPPSVDADPIPVCLAGTSNPGATVFRKYAFDQGSPHGTSAWTIFAENKPAAYTITDVVSTPVREIDSMFGAAVEVDCGTGFIALSTTTARDPADFPAPCTGTGTHAMRNTRMTNIQAVRWTINAGASGDLRLKVWNNPALPAGAAVNNCATATFPGATQVCGAYNLRSGPGLNAAKNVMGSPGSPYAPGPNGSYGDLPAGLPQGPMDVIYAVATGKGATFGEAVESPVIVDLLPAEVEFVAPAAGGTNWWRSYTYDESNAGIDPSLLAASDPDCVDPEFTQIDNFNGTGRTLLRWVFNDCTFPGGNNAAPWVGVHFSATIKPTAPAGGSFWNVGQALLRDATNLGADHCAGWDLNPPSMANPPIDSWDLDGDGNRTERYCGIGLGITSVPVKAYATSSKWVKGALDTGWSRYPASGDTNTAGDGTYELHLTNEGNTSLTTIDLIDVLPHVGDTSVVAPAIARGSEWGEELVSFDSVERRATDSAPFAAVAAADYQLGFSTTKTPCRWDTADPEANRLKISGGSFATIAGVTAPAGCTAPAWGPTQAGARSFAMRYTPTVPLGPGESIRLKVTIKGAAGELPAAPVTGKVAWNSFGFSAATNAASPNDLLLSTEPIQVGLKMVEPAASATLGNYVWIDTNHDGIQNESSGVAGVQVGLYRPGFGPDGIGGNADDAARIDVTDTDADGLYLFWGLPASTTGYEIRLDRPGDFLTGALAPYALTTANEPTSDDTDSDAALVGAVPTITGAATGAAGTSTLAYDFGFWQPASLGNYVWEDLDANGAQNDGEPPVNGVTVRLYNQADALQGTTTTSATGLYLFDNLAPGNYYVVFDKSTAIGNGANGSPYTGYRFTTPNITGDENTDSDPDSSGRSAIISLVGGQHDPRWDAGLAVPLPTGPNSIGDITWIDTDGDGIQNPTPLAGVTVTLLDTDGFPIASAVTDATGNYLFSNLLDGDYSLQFAAPPGFKFTTLDAAGSTDSNDSDAHPTSGVTIETTLDNGAAAEDDLTWDAGFIPTFSLGNIVWFDANDDGLRVAGDPLEGGIANVVVKLFDGTGATEIAVGPDGRLGTTDDAAGGVRSNTEGHYLFTNLAAGDYIVEITPPVGLTSSVGNGSNPSMTVGATHEGAPTPDQDTVATDNDDNGTTGGAVIRSVPVTLSYNAEPTPEGFTSGWADATPDADGNYQVDFGLAPPPPPSYDLAMAKVSSTSSVSANGDDITWTIRAQNQGSVNSGPFTVADTLPAGTSYNAGSATFTSGGTAGSVITPNPTPSITGQAMTVAFTNATGLVPGGYLDITFTTNVDDIAQAPFRNWAEISLDSGTDDDSTPDTNTGANATLPNDGYTGVVALATLGTDGTPGPEPTGTTDADDNDDAVVGRLIVSDLALTKKLAAGQVSTVEPGDDVTFTITVTNQGTVDVTNVEITDYIPAGWALNDTDWAAAGAVATHTVAALAAGASLDVPITLTVGAALPAPAAGTAAGTVSGSTFKDYNANGVEDSGTGSTAIDIALAGVVVTAFDSRGEIVGVGVTDSTGAYTINVTNAATNDLRLEFSAPTGLESSGQGTNSGSAVQFAAIGDTGVDAGFVLPADYCQNNPQLVLFCMVPGDPAGGGTSGTANVMARTTNDPTLNPPGPVVARTGPANSTIGTVWGLARHRPSGTLLAASFVRRHAGLGPAGIDGIYQLDPTAASPTPTVFVEVFDDLGIDVGGFTAPRGLTTATNGQDADPEAFPLVGKAGIGDIEMSDDDKFLFFTNLHDRTVYRVAVGDPLTVPTAADVTAYSSAGWLSTSPCTGGVARPGGLKVWRGTLYVGVTCTAETSGLKSDLRSVVYALDPATGATTQVLSASLDFQRGQPWYQNAGLGSRDPHAWQDVFNASIAKPNTTEEVHITPWLVDLEFDAAGGMILGFADRMAMQLGVAGNFTPAGVAAEQAYQGGDVLRACSVGGVWTLESNGSCGGTATTGAGNAQGPGGGEFYWGEFYKVGEHEEAAVGGLAQVPGVPFLAFATEDPVNLDSGGFGWLSNTTGEKLGADEAYRGFFAKGSGLSDMEAMCDKAPIEIGNRVWDDTDGDGVQDPGEPGISGVAVQLAVGATTVTATTDADGVYLFSSLPSGTGGTGAVYGVTALTAGAVATLTFPTTTAAGSLTTPDVLNGAGSDGRDSDPAIATGIVAVTLGSAGQTNHRIDAGYTTSPRRYGGHVCNVAELSNNIGDTDSTPDNVDGNSNGETPGTDDAITNPADEDDHDAACVEVVPADDLALRKTVTAFDGKSATFEIEVLNQGGGTVDSLDVTDYIDTAVWANFGAAANPAGTTGASSGAVFGAGTYVSPATLPTYVWDATDPVNPVLTLTGALASGESVTIPVTLTLKTGLAPLPTQAINRAEISAMSAGGSPVTDVDSTPDGTSTNDAGGNLGSAADNAIDGDGTGPVDGTVAATDEDDADPAAVPLYDLAIGKVLTVGQPAILSAPPMPPTVSYDIRVTNQGTATAYNVVVTDTPPAAMTYVAGSATGSSVAESGANTFTIPGPIVGGGTATITVTYQLNDLSGDTFVNVAEISAWDNDADATNPAMPFMVDIDSTPDTDATNDAGGALGTASDNSIGGDGTGTPGDPSAVTDEDDADPARVTLPYDLALRKRIDPTQPGIADGVADGEKVTFNIEIFNQARDINGVTVTDYIQPGWRYVAADNVTCTVTAGSYGSPVVLPTCAKSITDVAAGGESTIGLFGALDGGRSVVVPVVLTADFSTREVGVPVQNRAEISAFDDDGDSVTPFAGADRDSTPDSTDDAAGTPGGDELVDDIIDQTPLSNPADEDDHDVALLDWWDLSLVKTSTQYLLDAGVAPITADFTIEVKNQGPTDAFDVVVHDAAPAGTRITAVTPPVGVACGATGGSTIDCTIARLDSGDSKSYRVTVTIDDLSLVVYENNAEITSLMGDLDLGPGPTRVQVADVDSVPDTDLTNDTHFSNPSDPFGYPRNGSNDLDWMDGVVNTNVPNPADEDDRDIQAVIVPLAIGDYVWYDLDRDGRQETGELPVPGVTVHLLMEDPAAPGSFIDAVDASGVAVPDDVTDSNGWYAFDKLISGTYKVRFTLPAALTDYEWTTVDQGGVDSDATFALSTDDTAETAPFVLDQGEPNVTPVVAFDRVDLGALTAASIDRTRDAGIWMPVAVGDVVWYDLNYDGLQGGPGEGPVAGVTVTLQNALGGPVTDALGNPVAPFVTLADGAYVFDNLLPGTYRIVFSTLPVGYVATKPAEGGDVAVDSNPAPATLATPTFVLSPTGTNMQPNVLPGHIAPVIDPSIDMGIFLPLSLGDLVWTDLDHDGVFDPATESGLDGVTVTLLDGAGNPATTIAGLPVASTTTATGGRYSFTNLAPGDYRVRFTLPPDHEWTTADAPTDDTLDSDAVFTASTDATATTATFTLAITPVTDSDPAGRPVTNPSIDAGVWIPYAIGDVLWYDLDRSGSQNVGEAPVSGALVELTDTSGNPVLDADGTPVGSVTTLADGLYLFDNLLPGTYRVRFTHQQAGYRWTTADAVAVADGVDSDAVAAVNTDASASTDDIVLGVGQANVRPATAADDTTYGRTVQAQYIDPTNDAGIWIPLAVGDIAWYDLDREGTQNVADPVAAVTVTLLDDIGNPVTDADGAPVLPVVTLADGLYSFDNLLPGDYTIRFSTLPAGFSATGPTLGGDDELDSNANPATLTTPVFTLAPSGGNMVANLDPLVDAAMIDPTIDLGLIPAYSLGNRLWIDMGAGVATNNGIYDTGELPVDAATVELLDGAGDPIDPDGAGPLTATTTTTDSAGFYRFDGLAPGDYRVRVAAANFDVGGVLETFLSSDGASSDVTTAGNNNDKGIDGDPVADGITSGTVTLGAADPLTEVDAGATGNGANGPAGDAFDQLTVDFGFIQLFDLTLTKTRTSASPVVSGSTVTWDLVVTNNGPGTAVAGFTVTDRLPAGLSYTATPGAGTDWSCLAPTGAELACSYTGADLAAGASAPALTISTTIDSPSAGATLRNVGVVEPSPDQQTLETIPVGSTPDKFENGDDVPSATDPSNNDDSDTVEVSPSYSLGNRLWIDMGAGVDTNNGVRDLGEPAVVNATVELLDGVGNPIDPDGAGPLTITATTTDGSGYYRFDGLATGDYRVRVAAANFAPGAVLEAFASADGATADTTAAGNNADHGVDDPDPAANGITSGTATLGAGNPAGEAEAGATGAGANGPTGDALDNLTIDFGFIQTFDLTLAKTRTSAATVNLGGTVTWDLVVTNNGPGLAVSGFTVTDRLPTGMTYGVTPAEGADWTCAAPVGSEVTCTWTGADLAAGESTSAILVTSTVDLLGAGGLARNVAVVEPSPDQRTVESIPVGSTPDEFENGDNTPSATDPSNNDDSDTVTIVASYSLGNRLWIDMGPGAETNNGVFDTGEAPVDGATVELLDGAGNPIDPDGAGPLTATTTTSDAAGYYRFDGLAAGDYRVRVVAANFAAGEILDGTLSSDGASTDVTATGNNADHGVDDLAPATNGISSGTVTLGATDPTGDVDAGATGAGANGPTGDARDKLTVDFGFIEPFDLTLAKTRTSAATARPGSTVTWDLVVTNNGPGLAVSGLTVTDRLPAGLSYAATPAVGTDWTCAAAAGQQLTCTWNGADLAAGESAVTLTITSTVDTPPSLGSVRNLAVVEPSPDQLTPEILPVGSTPDRFENGDNTPSATDPSNNDDADVVEIVPVYSLGNRLWIDMGAGAATNNGAFDSGELSVDGAVVELLDGAGDPIDPDGAGPLTSTTTTTDTAGYYRFDGLEAGDYRVRVVAVNFAAGEVLEGHASSTGVSSDFTAAGNHADHGVDDPTLVVNGITSGVVTLGATNPIGEVEAGATGSGANGPTGDTLDNLTVDFGFMVPFDLTLAKTRMSASPVPAGSTVTFDLVVTNNGPGLAVSGFTVTDRLPVGMTYGATPGAGTDWACLAPTGADLACAYTGTDLNAGDSAPALTITAIIDAASRLPSMRNVAVVESSPDQLTPEVIPVGSTPDIFENGENTPSATDPSNNDDSDTVAIVAYSLGNRLWIDMGPGAETNNGVFDTGEAPVDGAAVELLDGTGNPIDPDGAGPLTATTTITDAAGYYRFDGLLMGDYRVRVSAGDFASGGPLEGFLSSAGASTDTAVTGNNADHGVDDPTPATNGITSGVVTLAAANPIGDVDPTATGAGANGPAGDVYDNLTIDFGFIRPFDLTLAKTLTSSVDAVAGSMVTWELVATNNGPGPAVSGLTITDRLPFGLTYAATPAAGTNWTCGAPAAALLTCTWTGADLAAGGSSSALTITSTVDTPAAGGVLRNAAVVEPSPAQETPEVIPVGTNPDRFENGDNTPSVTDPSNNDDSDTVTVPGSVYDLAVIKTAGAATVTPQGTITWTVRVANQGTLDSGAFTVVDHIPAGLALVAGSATTNAAAPAITVDTSVAGRLTWSVDNVPVAGSVDLSFQTTVSDRAMRPFRNWAEVGTDSGADDDSTPNGEETGGTIGSDTGADPTTGVQPNDDVVNHDTVSFDNDTETPLAAGPDEDDHDYADVAMTIYDLALAKTTSAAAVVPGDRISYTLRVVNQGTVASGAFNVTDRLATGTSFVSATGGGTQVGGVVTWNVADLAVGATLDLEVVVDVDSIEVLPLRNWAEITTDSAGALGTADVDSDPDTDTGADQTLPNDASTGAGYVSITDLTVVTPAGGQPAGDEDDNDDAVVTGAVQYDLALIKTASPASVAPGGTVTWTITVKNQGNVPSHDFQVTDTIPGGMTYNDDCTPACVGTGPLTWTVIDLAPGATTSFTFTTTVADILDRPFRNWAEISADSAGDYGTTDQDSTPDTDTGTDPGPGAGTNPTGDLVVDHDDINVDTPVGDEDDNDFAEVVGDPTYDLALVKAAYDATGLTAITAPVAPGDTITWKIRVRNQGNVTAAAFTVTDRIPTGLGLVAGSIDNGGTVAGQVVTWILADLAVGAEATLSFQTTITDPTAAPFRNWAEISADSAQSVYGIDDKDSTPDTNTGTDATVPNDAYQPIAELTAVSVDQVVGDEDDNDDATVALAVRYDLALAKVASTATVRPDDQITFTVRVVNQGNVASGPFDVTDTLPSGLGFVAADNGGAHTAGVVTWDNLASLIPGASIDLTVTTSIVDVTQRPFGNWAEISADSAALYGASTTDVDSTPDTITGTDDTLPNDDYVTVTDLATIGTDGAPAGDEDDNDDATVDVDVVYDLALVKVADTARVNPGDSITYTVTVKNQGNVPSGVYTILDTMATGVTFESATAGGIAAGAPATGQSVTWTMGTLAPGAIAQVSVTVRVTDATQRGLRNWAEITTDSAAAYAVVDRDSTPDINTGADTGPGSGTGPNDLVVDQTTIDDAGVSGDEDDNDLADVDVNVAYDLALAKVTSTTPDPTQPTAPVTFTIRVVNQGNVPARQFTVTDLLPIGTTFSSGSDGATATGRTVTWTIADLAAGASKDLTVSVALSDPAQRNLRNWAEISADSAGAYATTDEDSTPDANTGDGQSVPNDRYVGIDDLANTALDQIAGDEDDNDDSAYQVPVNYDLALAKRMRPGQTLPIPEGENVDFEIIVRNQGNVDSGAIKVVDRLPAGLTYVSADPGATVTGQDVIFDVDTLAPGQSRVLVVTVKVMDRTLAPFTNWAEISADSASTYGVTDEDSTPDDNTGTGSTPPNDRVVDLDTPDADVVEGDEDDNDLSLITADQVTSGVIIPGTTTTTILRSPGSIPKTGSSIGGSIAVGGVLLGLGLAAGLAARRRPRRRAR